MSKLKQKIAKKSQNSKKELKPSKKVVPPLPKVSSESSATTSKANESPTVSTSASSLNQTAPTNSNEDFKKAVDESRAAVATAKAPKTETRGRKPLPRDADGNIIRPSGAGQNQTQQVSAASGGADLYSGNNVQGKTSFLNARAVLSGPLKTISRLPARKHGISELELEVEESDAICDSIDKVVDAFLPDIERLSPKTVAVISASITVGFICMSKYLIYAEVQTARMEAYQHEQRALAEQAARAQASGSGAIDQRAQVPPTKIKQPFSGKQSAFA